MLHVSSNIAQVISRARGVVGPPGRQRHARLAANVPLLPVHQAELLEEALVLELQRVKTALELKVGWQRRMLLLLPMMLILLRLKVVARRIGGNARRQGGARGPMCVITAAVWRW